MDLLKITTLTLLVLGLYLAAMLACGLADESVQRELGNMAGGPQEESPTATPAPTPTPVPEERCVMVPPELVQEELPEKQRRVDGVVWHCDMYWPQPTPDATLTAKVGHVAPFVQQYRYLKGLAEMEEAQGASGASGETVNPPYGTNAVPDPIVNLMFFYESGPETTAAYEWLLEQLGETRGNTRIGHSLDYQLVSGRIPARLVEGMVDQPGFLYMARGADWETQ